MKRSIDDDRPATATDRGAITLKGALCVSLGLLLLVVALPVAAQGGAVMRVIGPTGTVPAGTSFDVRVSIEGAANLGSFQFSLGYDPAVISAEGAKLGPFMGSTGRSVNPLGPRTSPAGVLTFGAFTLGQTPGPNGQGDIATVTFRALQPGTTSLDLRDVQLTDIAGIGGEVTAEGTKVELAPTPGGAVPPGAVLAAVLGVLSAAAAAFVVIRNQRRSMASIQP